VLWQSAADADAAAASWGSHPAAEELAALVDPATVSRCCYETLD